MLFVIKKFGVPTLFLSNNTKYYRAKKFYDETIQSEYILKQLFLKKDHLSQEGCFLVPQGCSTNAHGDTRCFCNLIF